MLFPNDLAIAADGVVWFSDASRRFDQHHWMLDFLEGRATGRLLRYDPRTNRVDVVLDHLMFANGVALGPGDKYVLVNPRHSRRRNPAAGATPGRDMRLNSSTSGNLAQHIVQATLTGAVVDLLAVMAAAATP